VGCFVGVFRVFSFGFFGCFFPFPSFAFWCPFVYFLYA
jgi:hypothetical protein